MVIRGKVSDILAEASSVKCEQIVKYLETPPDAALGDLACTVAFELAKTVKKNPAIVAAEIAASLEDLLERETLIERVETKGPYINIFLDPGQVAGFVLPLVARLGDKYGQTETYAGKRALIESPSVNPSKPWHIGHSRNATIGDTLTKILSAVGYDAVLVDYINDLGLQIAQLTWKLMQMEDVEPDEKYDHYLGKIYVEVQKEFENNKVVEAEIREVARRLEDLDSEEAETSGRMVTRCLEAQNRTAYRLGIYHDYQVWESSIAHSGLLTRARSMMLDCENVERVESGEKKGCIVARLDTIDQFKDMQDPSKVLFRSDGTRTYTGADVAFQMWKFGIVEDPFLYRQFAIQPDGSTVYRTALDGDEMDLGKFDVVFNVIGSGQAHPQRLIYSLLDIMGYHEQSENSHHIAYEFVGLEEADFSGRKGTWMGYTTDDVLDQAQELAREEVAKRNPDADDAFLNQVAAQVATGALRYFMLSASPDRKITFRWDEALDFNGDAAPYLQYSHARAKRILEKTENQGSDADLSLLDSEHEFALVKAISRFPEEILEVVRGLTKNAWGTGFSSNRLTAYCYELATLFSRFYDNCPVLKAEEELKQARLAVVRAFRMTMANCLGLLGIPIVDRM
jgi:arginyl-tRNA synthetase